MQVIFARSGLSLSQAQCSDSTCHNTVSFSQGIKPQCCLFGVPCIHSTVVGCRLVQDEALQELLEQLRGKYKTVLAALGKSQEYSTTASGASSSTVQQPLAF